MSAGDTAEADLLKLLFQNVNWANVGDATGLRGSTTAGSFFINTATANPGETGTQTTSESAFTNYVRVGVPRSAAAWAVSGTAPTQASNIAAVTYASAGSGPETQTHFGVGRDPAGAGELLFSGALTASLIVNPGIVQSFAASALIVTMD